MPTVITFECEGGAIVAADRTVVRGSTVASTAAERILDFDDCGGAAVDDPAEVRRNLGAEVRAYRLDHDRSPGIEPVTQLAVEVVREVGTDAVVVARDDDGRATVRAVYADGSVIKDDPLALGSGAELALGQLETAPSLALGEAEEFAREVLAGVAERDPRTGEEVDVWTLADADDARGAESSGADTDPAEADTDPAEADDT